MGFDALAPHYDWMERLVAGGVLQRARLAWIDAVSAQRILLVGEGHGRFLLPLGRMFPESRITCVDASAGMLRVARKRVEHHNPGGLGRIEWIHASVPDWKPTTGGYDLIVTNFFLDCFAGDILRRVVECLAAGSRAEGHWLVTDFALPQHPLVRPWARGCLWMMYRFFRATTRLQAVTLESPFPLLAACGFRRIHSREELGGFVTSQFWRHGASREFYSG